MSVVGLSMNIDTIIEAVLIVGWQLGIEFSVHTLLVGTSVYLMQVHL